MIIQSPKERNNSLPYEGGGPMTGGNFSASKGLPGLGKLRAAGKLYKLELSIDTRGEDARELGLRRATLITTRPIVRCKKPLICIIIKHRYTLSINLQLLTQSQTYLNMKQNNHRISFCILANWSMVSTLALS